MAIYKLEDKSPQIADTAWVAESAQVMGDVVLAPHASSYGPTPLPQKFM